MEDQSAHSSRSSPAYFGLLQGLLYEAARLGVKTPKTEFKHMQDYEQAIMSMMKVMEAAQHPHDGHSSLSMSIRIMT